MYRRPGLKARIPSGSSTRDLASCSAGFVQESAEEARKVVAMNPNHAQIVAGCGSELTTVGEYKLAKELIERAKKLNPHYPSWYHFVDYVRYFRHGEYEKAWTDKPISAPFRRLLPIPQVNLDVSEGLLEQNPGY